MNPDNQAANRIGVKRENKSANQNQNNKKSKKGTKKSSADNLGQNGDKKVKSKAAMFTYMEFEEKPKRRELKPHLQPHTCKGKLRNFLHSKPCHYAVIILTLVDVGLVMTEIILDLKKAEACAGHGQHHVESVGAKVVHYMSIAILSIFLVEIMLKLIADWEHFWAHKIEIIDAIVVIVAFGCDVAVSFVGTEAFAAVGLLILLRLWRVVRIVNGITLVTKTEADEKVHALEHRLEEKEEEFEKLKRENRRLKEILAQNQIHVEDEPSDEPTGSDVNGTSADDENIITIET